MTPPADWLVPLLVCPECRGPLRLDGDFLVGTAPGCGDRYPVIDGIPRLLRGGHRPGVVRAHRIWFDTTPERAALAGTWESKPATPESIVAAFDDEWSRHATVGTPDHSVAFDGYADLVPASAFDRDLIVLDAGCGAGRWSYQIATRGPRVIALDLGRSVEVAARNTRSTGRVAAIQADVRDCPITVGGVDWACCLGVLHHVPDAGPALARVAASVRRGGFVLIYLYYALDGRGPLFRAAFFVVDRLRRVTSHLPRAATRVFADAIAVTVYWPLARLSLLLARIGACGLSDAIPLRYYRDQPLRAMRNDSLDRFGTTLELRYTREGFISFLEGSGLGDVAVSPLPPFWHGVGRRRGDRE